MQPNWIREATFDPVHRTQIGSQERQTRSLLVGVWCLVIMLLTLTSITASCARKPSPDQQSGTRVQDNSNRRPDANANEPSAVLKLYCEFEQKQEYAKMYALLSDRRKKYLEKFNVRNSEQYRDLRESSEAAWSDFVIEGSSDQPDGRVSFVGHARVEETGEARQLPFEAILSKERGKWKVDDWKY